MSPESPAVGRVRFYNRNEQYGEILPTKGGSPIPFTIEDFVMVRSVEGKPFLSPEQRSSPRIHPELRVAFCVFGVNGDTELRIAPFNVWKACGGKGSMDRKIRGSLVRSQKNRTERRSQNKSLKRFY
ncbi:MAG: hypothetical protein WCV55_03445 [Candidatus Paceibacterota bacterium]